LYINRGLVEVRDVAAGSPYDPPQGGISKGSPSYNIYSNDIRCGRDGPLHGKDTQTATVIAESEMGMGTGFAFDVSYLF